MPVLRLQIIVMGIIKCSIPLNVQFEITYGCNNNCIFCYNADSLKEKAELDTREAISIIKDMASCGVLSVNFNGGEPLSRKDYFDIIAEADRTGMDIHMNTNSSLIDVFTARMVAKYFQSVCTTVLSGSAEKHDRLSGRKGAFKEALRGIRNLQDQSVYVAVNVMLSKMNLSELEETFGLMRDYNIRSVLITRYVPCGSNDGELHISDEEFLDAVSCLYRYNDQYRCFDRIAFPQPFKLCHVSGELHSKVAESNIACNIGLCTASISPNGDLTPCNLVKEPVLGNLRESSFKALWSGFKGEKYCLNEHLAKKCISCPDITNCGGGCKGYNDAMRKK